MNFANERELFAAAGLLPPPPVRAAEPGVRRYWRPIVEHRWLILAITFLALLIGAIRAMTMPPVYEANLLIQVADSVGTPKSVMGETANMFDIKTPSSAEIEILRSRMVVAPAVENNRLWLVAQPRYFALLGGWYARQAEGWPLAGLVPQRPRVIEVRDFQVPPAWEGKPFIVKATAGGGYTLRHKSLPAPIEGRVGELLTVPLGDAQLSLFVSRLEGAEGAEFTVLRKSNTKAIEDLLDDLKIVERARQSGIIEATLRDSDPARAAAVLKAIGGNYLKQAVERKTLEADKSLTLLNHQLPQLKQQMEQHQDAYNAFRARKGSLLVQEEARMAVERLGERRGRLAETEQKRRELLSEYGSLHPKVKVVEEQIASLQQEIRGLQGRMSAMPAMQQDAEALEREAKMSSEMYRQLRSSALQLQLVREGMTGNARVLDAPVIAEEPVRPRPALILGVAGFCGLALALLFAYLRAGLTASVRDRHDIEGGTGLTVFSASIPMTRTRALPPHTPAGLIALSRDANETTLGLRQLRALLQRQMRDGSNNRLLVTGPTAGVGVHFLIKNLGALSAAAGHRTLIIDAVAGNASLRDAFALDVGPGLAELVSGSCTLTEAIQATRMPRLDVVTAGAAPLDLERLATSHAFLDLLDHASRQYDAVLLTGPPVLRSSETLWLASAAGSVVLVARARKTALEEITESARRLAQAGQVPSGVVLNGI